MIGVGRVPHRRVVPVRPVLLFPVPLSPVLVALVLVLTGCTAPTLSIGAAGSAGRGGYTAGVPVPKPYAMPDRTLTDTAGQPYNLATSPSKPVTLLFFGYTHCPDVCTAVLGDMALALQRMDPADRDQLQVIFVTTDPARDTPPVIRAYLDRFDPSFLGLTGPMAAIRRVAGQVGVEIEGRQRLPDGGYDIGHSAQVTGFSRTRGVVLWTPGTPIGDLRADYTLLLDRSR